MLEKLTKLLGEAADVFVKSFSESITKEIEKRDFERMSDQMRRRIVDSMTREYLDAAHKGITNNYLAKNIFHHNLKELGEDCVDREDYIVEACTGKKVLHFGFVDAPFKASLHAKIRAVVSWTWGIDNNAAAVDAYKVETLDVGCSACDIEEFVGSDDPNLDLVLVPELLEHVHNVGNAMSRVRQICGEHGCDAIITVPNAFFVGNLFAALEGVESVHPDHRCWFSPHTLTRCITDAGLRVKEFKYYTAPGTEAMPGATKSGLIARVCV